MATAKLRTTAVRLAIFDTLITTGEPMSMQEILSRIKGDGHFVSVYRSVDAMHKAGILRQVPRGFKNLFELSDLFRPHHHHATCDKCGIATEIHDEKLESIMQDLARKAGLEPTTHHFEIHGICTTCRSKSSKP